jgi:hypothetical protein
MWPVHKFCDRPSQEEIKHIYSEQYNTNTNSNINYSTLSQDGYPLCVVTDDNTKDNNEDEIDTEKNEYTSSHPRLKRVLKAIECNQMNSKIIKSMSAILLLVVGYKLIFYFST